MASWFDDVASPANNFYGEWVNPLQGIDFSQDLAGRDFHDPSSPGYQAAIKKEPNYYADPTAVEAVKTKVETSTGDEVMDFALELKRKYPNITNTAEYIANAIRENGGFAARSKDYWENRLKQGESYQGGGGGQGTLPGINTPPISLASYTAPAPYSFQPYQAPAPFSYQDFQAPTPFKAPTMEEALNDPGYQFALKEGEDALQRSASAKGTLLTGGTGKDLLSYGQRMGTQQYDKVYGRDLGEYQQHYQELADTYDRNRGNAFQNYTTNANLGAQAYGLNASNSLAAYQTNLGAAQNAYQFNNQNALNTWDRNRLAGLDAYGAGQDTFNNTYKLATLGQNSTGTPDPYTTTMPDGSQSGVDPRTGLPYTYRPY
jgi:hypothetical protein